jgi:ribosomal protein S6
MEKILNHYEMMLLAPVSVSDDVLDTAISQLQNVIVEDGGSLLALDKWGSQMLAYEIRKNRMAKFFVIEYVASASVPLELERLVRLDTKTFLRFLTVALDKNVTTSIEDLKKGAADRITARQNRETSFKQDKVRYDS